MNWILSPVIFIGLSMQLSIISSYSTPNYNYFSSSNKWTPIPVQQHFLNAQPSYNSPSRRYYTEEQNFPNYSYYDQRQSINQEWEQRRNGYNYNSYQNQGNMLQEGFKTDFQFSTLESELMAPHKPQQLEQPFTHKSLEYNTKSCTTWTSPEGIRFNLSPYGQLGNSIQSSHYSKNGNVVIFTGCDSTANRIKSNYFSRPYYSPGSASDFVSID